MSFRAQTILILIVLSLTPYVITMGLLGYVYSADVEARVRQDMRSQLSITVDRLDQVVQALRNDLRFIASLDVMNDILTGDIDQRILNLLLLKKQDLALVGDFYVLDMSNKVIAATDVDLLGAQYEGERFAAVPLFSTFAQEQIGQLLVRYEQENFVRLFPGNENLDYSFVSTEAVSLHPSGAGVIYVEQSLAELPQWKVGLSQATAVAMSALNSLTRMLLIALVVGTIVIAAVAFLIANYILKPVLQLSRTARSITQTQDYSQRVVVARSDEIGQLSLAFNHMIKGMQEMIERVRQEGENRLKLAKEQDRAEMLQTLSNKLSKYLSPQIYESIFSGEKDVTLSSSRKKLTIFFSDIVNFTETTDQMESEDLTQLLNQYLDEMTKIALAYGATVDKYIGDAIMIFFGDPQSAGIEEDARKCVSMAVAMQRRVRELYDEWQRVGYTKPFKIRIGIHTGFCTVGNFGTESRMEYTIIGSSVNLASRIETNAMPGCIYMSEDTYLLVKGHFQCLPVKPITPKGLAASVPLYRVIQAEDEAGTVAFEAEGVSLYVDSSTLSADSRAELVRILANIHDADSPRGISSK